MASITKNRLDREQIEKIVKKSFGQETELLKAEELTDGLCNAAYRLRISGNRAAILKVAPAEVKGLMAYEHEMMRTEVLAMQLAEENQVPGVAKIYAYDTDKDICGSDYFLMEEMEGVSYFKEKEHLSAQEQAAIDFQIGQRLALVHRIKGERFGHFCDRNYQSDNWFDTFYAMVNSVIADGISVGVEVGVPYDKILEKLQEHKGCFAEVTTPQLVHWDSWEGNIFIKDGKVTALIDWERALWAEGLMEDRFRFHNVKETFLQGYGLPVLTKNQQIRSYWYDVYLYLIMMFEGKFRHYETDEQYKWVHVLFVQVWERVRER